MIIYKKNSSYKYELFKSSGGYLLSQVVSNQVPSALRALTSVFGMVTGVSLLLLLPHFLITIILSTSVFDQVFDILVQLGLKYYYSYTYCLSTLWSSRCLTLRKSYLKGGFVLRCFQLLSFPNVATELCNWRYNS